LKSGSPTLKLIMLTPLDANSRPSLVILRVADSDRLLILLDKVLMVNYFERKYINQILFCTKKDIVFLI